MADQTSNDPYTFIPDNPYLLLTPGPLSTSKGVRNAMLQDWCTWDADYNQTIVQDIRRRLVALATTRTQEYTAVLMQGSGSFSVEATLGGLSGKLLIATNGAYGDRMVQMADVLGIDHCEYAEPETQPLDPARLDDLLAHHPDVTHVAMVHCETTTGMVNPVSALTHVARAHGTVVVVDAMSSFGGIPMDIADIGIDFLISSANKCIQGVPGFGFVIARRSELEKFKGQARSLSLDLYSQWSEMNSSGKWRYTSPTHVVRAFAQALDELDDEGGVLARNARYQHNQDALVAGMEYLGFQALLARQDQSPIITSFLYPGPDFDFNEFYHEVKARGFVLYPGKISQADTFRIGTIGEVYPEDIERLLTVIAQVRSVSTV